MAIFGNHRRFSLLVTASLLAVVSTFGWLRARPEMSGDAAAHMRRAAAYYDSVVVLARVARVPAHADSVTTIALGYLERLRLGLGSPFRLVDFALSDPRLDDSTRSRVAWAILARLRRGDAYVIDPSVGDAVDAPSGGGAQLALIQRTIESARDPRAGELTVRLAYALAAGERTVGDQGDAIAAQAAALLRDRALAQADLRDLLRDADGRHVDPLGELVRRRRSRSFVVERPAGEPLDEQVQASAMAAVPRLLESIRALRQATDSGSRAADGAYSSLLGVASSARLVSLGLTQPPEPPVAVTVRTHRSMLLAPDAPADIERARGQFASTSVNAETLAGEFGLLVSSGDTVRRTGALAVLAAATALRAMAQEEPWFAGLPAPSVADLRAEFGLAGVAFDRDVRREWQPYYLRMIGTSLRDMQRVLGGLSEAGLRIAVAATGLPDTILALHDPSTRTIRMSVFSSSGTLAHELAHDLDWQAARSLYAGSGYSTDRAVREQRGPLAAAVQEMTYLPESVRDGFLAQWADARSVDPYLLVRHVLSMPLSRRRIALTPSLFDDDPISLTNPEAAICADHAGLAPELRARQSLLDLALDARALGLARIRAGWFSLETRPAWASSILGAAPWSPVTGQLAVRRIRAALVGQLDAPRGGDQLRFATPSIFRPSASTCSLSER